MAKSESSSDSTDDTEERARLASVAVKLPLMTDKVVVDLTKRKTQQTREERKDYELEPDCQRFLAKKLDEVLERHYNMSSKKHKKEKGCDNAEVEKAVEASAIGGIRLFSDSRETLTEIPEVERSKGQRHGSMALKRRRIVRETKVSEAMLASCAVTAEWVMNNPVKRASQGGLTSNGSTSLQ